MSEGWIGVDLDGTWAKLLAEHKDDELGLPHEKMMKRIKRLIKMGYDVRVFTARADNTKAIHAVEDWLEKHLGELLPITNVKDHEMIALLDDRAVHVDPEDGDYDENVLTELIEDYNRHEEKEEDD